MTALKYILSIVILSCLVNVAHAQFSSVKTNVLGLAISNINVALDVKLATNKTLNIPVSFNPFTFGDFKVNYVAIQPGVRFWLYENYLGHFISGYVVGTKFDSEINKIYRTGWATGVGCSYGYSWLLSTRWSFETEFGVGLIYTDHEKGRSNIDVFDRETIEHHNRILLLPTKAALSFCYLF